MQEIYKTPLFMKTNTDNAPNVCTQDEAEELSNCTCRSAQYYVKCLHFEQVPAHNKHDVLTLLTRLSLRSPTGRLEEKYPPKKDQ